MGSATEMVSASNDSKVNYTYASRKEQSKSLFFQPKLTIGPADDAYEREADAVADQVMRKEGTQHVQMKVSPVLIQRNCTACEEEEKLQRKEMVAGQLEAPSIVQDTINSNGVSLDRNTRSFMEGSFGYDFGNVKIHTDTVAKKSAQSINALAYTSGENIVFNEGQYAPETQNGKRLLAHELTHTVQQGAVQKKSSERNSTDGPSLQEANKNSIQQKNESIVIRRAPGDGAGSGSKAPPPPTSKTITIDFVKLKGSSRSPTTDLTELNTIYKKCNVQFAVGQDKTASDTVSEKWLGGDTDLKWDTKCGLEAEEKSMWDGATADFKLSSRMRVFYVASLTPATAYAYSRPPFCAKGVAAPYVNHAVIPNTALKDTLAHEMGHILLNSGDHHGIDDPADKKNLMFAPGRTASDLDKSQCAAIFSNA